MANRQTKINTAKDSLDLAQDELDKFAASRKEAPGVSIPVDSLGSTTQMNIPSPTVPDAPVVPDLPAPTKLEASRDAVSATQKRILELSGKVGEKETFRQDLFEEQGLGDATQQLTDIDSTLNLLKAQRDQLDLDKAAIPSRLQEQFAGVTAGQGGTKAGLSSLQSSELRKNFLQQSTIASQQLLEQAKQQNLQGNIQTSLDLIDQATNAKFAPLEAELLAEKEQYDFALANFEQEFTEAETLRLEELSAKKATELENIETQKVFESDKNELQLIASQAGAPLSVQRAIANAGSVSEAIIAAGPYLSEGGADEIKSSINNRRGITGTEKFDITKLPADPFGQKEQIAEYITQVFPEYPDIALAIASAESLLDTVAHGDKGNKLAPEGSHGVFQINTAVHKDKLAGRDVNDWKDNIDIAREIFDEAGGSFKPWGAFTDNRYKEFLTEQPVQSQFDEQLAKQPGLYGIPTRLVDSDKDTKRFEALIESAFADGGSPQEVILKVQQGMLGFQINKGKEDEAAALLPYLQSLSEIESSDYQSTARLINSGKTEQAVTRIENKLYDDTDKDYKARQTLAQESAVKVKAIEELLEKVPVSDLGIFDAAKLEFKDKFFQNANQDTIALRAKLVALMQPYRKDNLGSAVTETELKAIEGLMASIKDNPQTIRTKLKEFETAMRDSLNAARTTANLPLTNVAVLRGEQPKSSLYLNVGQAPSSGQTSTGLSYTIE